MSLKMNRNRYHKVGKASELIKQDVSGPLEKNPQNEWSGWCTLYRKVNSGRLLIIMHRSPNPVRHVSSDERRTSVSTPIGKNEPERDFQNHVLVHVLPKHAYTRWREFYGYRVNLSRSSGAVVANVAPPLLSPIKSPLPPVAKAQILFGFQSCGISLNRGCQYYVDSRKALRHVELLKSTVQLDFVPPALDQQTRHTLDLETQVKQLTRGLIEVQRKTKAGRREFED
ncbi:uncharacterized protein BT62DRAFT_1009504 [Guyanagaster necrorhizus]|uniref:Uncharacterized protein n=1 Tax=Guyanagaster necrorhizus TaxID=856835 RepID=A0A9P7VLE3_9AGAR|nr:uncharacterized protein BT62DRAFT_1009504 [Guyanagaster necrorhizus MCA 3950]KAG7443296.1 hypothetical protein BT62DRAFT_1009504 [Guyanagaster necrorhizus MCA 3950]